VHALIVRQENMSDDVLDEFGDDGALDERDTIIDQLKSRTNAILNHEHFDAIDLSGARANVAMLRTIIKEHGGNHLIKKAEVEAWLRRMLEVFSNPAMWGFAGSDPEQNAKWKAGCEATASQLSDLLEE
jgi:hypothetical protein